MRAAERARELWFTAPRAVEVRNGSVPECGEGQVLVRALASGVSQGTELLLYRGEGPTPFDPSLDLPGAPTYPRRYGYAWVGEVVDTRARVFCLAAHGDWHAIGAERARAIGDGVPATRAVLAANLETAITCVWDSGASVGDEVVVLGAGVVGLLVTWLLARAGARVSVVEPSEHRRALAMAMGALQARPPADDAPAADADIVVEASGDPAALDRAVAHAGREATIVVASFYGARRYAVALGGDFHRRRLKLAASQVSSIPPARAPRWSFERRFALVARLLEDDELDALVDNVVPFDDAPSAYARLDRAPGDSIQTVLTYR